jgi:hypothetical protein
MGIRQRTPLSRAANFHGASFYPRRIDLQARAAGGHESEKEKLASR